MKKHSLLFGAWAGFFFGATAAATADQTIPVYTNDCVLTFSVSNQHLNFKSIGTPNQALGYAGEDLSAYPTEGSSEQEKGSLVALSAIHADQSAKTDLILGSHSTKNVESGVTETRFNLQDSYHAFKVTLIVRAFETENVFEEWAEISQNESGKVTLTDFASGSLVVPGANSQLVYFPNNYYQEMQETVIPLSQGCKIVDTKMGIRNGLIAQQDFLLSLNGTPTETSGQVIGGTIAWSGSWRESFDIDDSNNLRIIAGINPTDSEWHLNPGESFVTPRMIFTYSPNGMGAISRQLHRWARNHQIRDGNKEQQWTYLNNWQTTGFGLNAGNIDPLIPGTASLGLEMFLLDDGWFGNGPYARVLDQSAIAGLGDWQTNTAIFPDVTEPNGTTVNGIEALVQRSQANNIKFGIWMEPEMVNPLSNLYVAHPDWVITQPKRAFSYFRNQLILDLSNPAVEQFCSNAIDTVMQTNPGISFMKWDCNRPMNNAGSFYLPADQQSELRIRYVQALHRMMKNVATKYPNMGMMLCSGGGGRVDYDALQYFQEFWPSDDTDPFYRIFIQWGYSYFYPNEIACAEVTTTGGKPLKFCFDVALTGRLGMDYPVNTLSQKDAAFCAQAIELYKTDVRPFLLTADLYRLESPYNSQLQTTLSPVEGSPIYANRASTSFVSPDQKKAMLFTWQMNTDPSGPQKPIKLQGLNPDQGYLVTEVDLNLGTTSKLAANGTVVEGSVLMNTGLSVPDTNYLDSCVVELTAAKSK